MVFDEEAANRAVRALAAITDARQVTEIVATVDQAVAAEAATDGWYALLTNLPASITAAQVLARYKNQPGV